MQTTQNTDSESETSQHSFEYFEVSTEKQYYYKTTNLIIKPNLYLPEIAIEQLSPAEMKAKYERFLIKQGIYRNTFGCVDPRQELKKAKVHGPVETLVDYEYIRALTQFATEMHISYVQESDHSQPQEGQMEIDALARLSSRIVHDHSRNAFDIDEPIENQLNNTLLHKQQKESKQKRKFKETQKQKLKEIQYLVQNIEIPLMNVAKRMKIGYQQLRSLIRHDFFRVIFLRKQVQSQERFSKIHQRARNRISELIVNSQFPLQLSDIQKDLKQSCQLTISRSHLHKYLRENLNVSYRLLRPICTFYNYSDAKLQRQYAASQYISFMSDQKRIINIDESVLRLTDHRKRGWLLSNKHNQVTKSRRLSSINIIAGISNLGELYYTVNQGKTNGSSFIYFIVKLCEYLNNTDKNWRSRTMIMIDNAPYHRSIAVKDQLQKLKVPLIYLGPYQSAMAPIELFFSYIKSKDLNPLNYRIPSQGAMPVYVKELAMHISRFPQEWIQKAFLHVLPTALEALALSDL